MRILDCDICLDLMPLVKDGAASEASKKAVEAHLATCPSCRECFGALDSPCTAPEKGFEKFQEKVKKRVSWLLVLGILISLIPVAVLAVFCGNPISAAIVSADAQRYIAKTYPGNDFAISDPQYSLKSMGYTVEVRSHSSRDTDFVLTYSYFGTDRWDGYESYVLSGQNTFARISEDVRQLLEEALKDLEYSSVGLSSNWPSIYDEFGYPFDPPEEIDISSLKVDGSYDPKELSAKYGRVEISLEVEEVSAEEICRILKDLHETLTSKGLSVRTVDVTIYNLEKVMTVAGFPYEKIPQDDLPQQVKSAADQWEQFQKEYDKWLADRNQP